MARPRSHSGKSRTAPTLPQPTVIYPVVNSPADDPELSDADLERLEVVAGIGFTPSVRTALRNIGAGWVAHDRMLQSPRPRAFQKRLQAMAQALERVIGQVDLNRTGAPVLDRHLFIWLLNADFDAAREMLATSSAVVANAQELIGLLAHVEQALPVDRGRPRPMDEDRFIIYLADQFEASGGQTSAYRTAHTESGYAEKPFRNFVHEFYKLLPITSRRTESGLDEAILRALKYRRRCPP
jgi:hypothetical protein